MVAPLAPLAPLAALLLGLAACQSLVPAAVHDGDTGQAGTSSDSGTGVGDGGTSGADGGTSVGDGGTMGADCEIDDDLSPSTHIEHQPLTDSSVDLEGEAWFPVIFLDGLSSTFTGTARVCRDLADGTQACSAEVDVSGAEISLPSTLLAAGSLFHVQLSDDGESRCTRSVEADLDELDFDAAGLQVDTELPWTAPADVDIPPTLLGVAIHRGSDTGAPAMTVVASVSSIEGLQQTALVRFTSGDTDAVQPLPDGTGWYLLSRFGILRLRLEPAGAVLEEWEMIPADQRCSPDGRLLRDHAPPTVGTCMAFSHGMVVGAAGSSSTVISESPSTCPEDLSQNCLLHNISSLQGGEIEALWSYEDHVDEIAGRKLDNNLPYINGLGSDGEVTCAAWFSLDFDTNQTIPAVICVGVTTARTVFDLDADITHVPHDVDPITLADGRRVLVIADNTNGDMDSSGSRKPPRIQLYDLPMDEASPDVQLDAIASYDTDIHVAENYRFGSVASRVNRDGQLVTVYVDGSGVHELGVIDLDTDVYTPLARTAITAPGGTLTNEADRGARKLGSYALDTVASAGSESAGSP